MDVCLKLEKVQVTPGSLNGIVYIEVRITAFWTRKFATPFEIYVDVQLFPFDIEVEGLDIPRGIQIQSLLEKVFL